MDLLRFKRSRLRCNQAVYAIYIYCLQEAKCGLWCFLLISPLSSPCSPGCLQKSDGASWNGPSRQGSPSLPSVPGSGRGLPLGQTTSRGGEFAGSAFVACHSLSARMFHLGRVVVFSASVNIDWLEATCGIVSEHWGVLWLQDKCILKVVIVFGGLLKPVAHSSVVV